MITRDLCDNLRADLAETLKALEDKYGVKFTVGTMRYSDIDVSISLSAVMSGVNKDKFDFERNCYMYSLKPNNYGMNLEIDGKWYVLTGVSSKRNAVRPLIVKRVSDGKVFSYMITPDIKEQIAMNNHLNS